MTKAKILLVGKVGDHLKVLHKKLTTLNSSKAGPFHVCFCVGPVDLKTESVDAFPLPVYLQQVTGEGDSPADDQGIVKLESATNLFHLRGKTGKEDAVNTFEIAVDGADPLLVTTCPKHVRADSSNTNHPQCDLLLTHDWPQGMEDVLQVDTEPLSYDVAQVALSCRPRYHVCPSTRLYHASPPYHMPKSDHVGRFLALAPVTAEKTSKTTKFIHALGLEPLKSNPPPTTAPSTLPCPFLPSGDTKAPAPLPGFVTQQSNGDGGYSHFAKSNKRSRNQENNDSTQEHSLEPPDDPNISTLFLYGLHKDVTGELQSTRSPKVLQAFVKYGCSRVRHPPNTSTSTYCFLEFPSQKEALECILDCQGKITIDGVDLTLKWAAPKKETKRPRREQHHVTQAEAKDSTTLYFHPSKQNAKEEDGAEPTPMDDGFAESLRQYLEKTLEDALNEGADEDDERVTAETEPALKVEVRTKEHFGFLDFASHAAATMALAALTKSTDGGFLQAEPDGAPVPPSELVGTALRWAKGGPPAKKKGDRDEVLEALGLKRQFYPADSRTDCWFCLASPSCETHLITGVYNEWYSAMPKGPVHPGHVLLVPVTHTREGAWNLSEEWLELVDKLQLHASQAYDADLFVFERSMETKGGYHTHVQVVPVPRDSITNLQTTMLAHAKASGFDLRPIQSDLGVKAMMSKDDSYFYAEIRTQSQNFRFFYRHEAGDDTARSVPLQFAREVLASVLKNPKLAHWKACVVDKEQEAELATTFRESFNATMGSG
jgi:diadenosine tetraphosphate (Ap4A) HIT family hydrolase